MSMTTMTMIRHHPLLMISTIEMINPTRMMNSPTTEKSKSAIRKNTLPLCLYLVQLNNKPITEYDCDGEYGTHEIIRTATCTRNHS